MGTAPDRMEARHEVAAMDPDGAVFQHKYKPSPVTNDGRSPLVIMRPYAVGVPVQAWTEAVVQGRRCGNEHQKILNTG